MPSSYSVIHRYTPPTCTLEISAKKPRFPWQDFSTEDLRFELRFDDPKLPNEKQTVVRGDRPQLEHLCEVVTCSIETFLRQPPSSLPLNAVQDSQIDTVATLTSPLLRSRSLLAHELLLEPLAVEASGKTVQLSTLQLFDLAEALEGSLQTITSPQLHQAKSRKAALVWVGAVAVLLAVALPVGFELFTQNAEEDELTLQEIEVQPTQPAVELVPPDPPAPTDIPQSSPTLPPPLASQERLQPPPPVDVPTSSSLPTPPTVPVPPPAPNSSPQTTTKIIPSQPTSPRTIPVIPNQPASPPKPSVPVFSSPNTGSSELPELRALQSQPSDLNITPEGTAVTKAPESARINSSEPDQTAPAAVENAASTTASLNQIPQLAEVKAYFEKEWQPPTSLEETLEYRLVLNRDGSIKRVVPLGQAAKVYLDRTNMPLMGESFVSPLSESAAAPQIRLFLGPNGTVKTFLEL